MQTNHPRAKEVAYQMGCLICDLNAARTEFEIDCTVDEFAEMLAEIESDEPANTSANFDRSAYVSLQNEGFATSGDQSDPSDEFSAGREEDMVTLKQIKDAMAAKDYSVLRALHDQAKTNGIEDCDEMQLSTVNLAVLEVSIFRGDASFERNLVAMLGAIERGNHPYDDIITMSTLGAEAAIAQAQIYAIVGKK